MFAPEVVIEHWKDFVQLLRNADVIVYSKHNRKITVQVWNKCLNVVFSHTEPEFNKDFEYKIMGRRLSTKPLIEKLREIENCFKEGKSYLSAVEYRKMGSAKREYEHRWWSRRLRKVVRFLRALGAVEGYFASIVTVGVEE